MMKSYSVLLATILFIGFANAQSTFLPPRPIGPNMYDVPRPLVLDIDADGINEVVLAPKSGNTAALNVNNGTVTGFRRLVADPGLSRTIHVADINADGFPEIIRSGLNVLSPEDTASMFVHWGGTMGSYGAPNVVREGRACLPHLVADITGDQYPEIICNSGQGTIEIYHYVAAEDELRLLRSIVIGGYYFFMTTGDMDGDGVEELIFAPSNNSSGTIRYWSPVWGLSSPPLTLGTYVGSNGRPIAEDLDQNGTIDVFVATEGGWSQFNVWSNLGDLTFQHITDLPLGYDAGKEYWLGDADGDGVIDLLYARAEYVLRKRFNADFSLTEADTVINLNTAISSFLRADLNSDGYDELFVIGQDERLSIYTGNAAPLQYDDPIELFKWHENIEGMGAAFTSDGTQPAIAFISGGPSLEVHLLPITSSTDIPRSRDFQIGKAPPPSASYSSVRSVDFDGDGDLDLFGCRSTNSSNPCHLFAIENDNDGPIIHCLAENIQLDAGEALHYSDVDLFDISGDGLSDIIILASAVNLWGPQQSSPADQLLMRNSPFTAVSYFTELTPRDYALRGDMDHDGDDDLVVHQVQDSEVVIRINEGSGQFPVAATFPWNFGTYVLVDVDGDQDTDACWFENVDDTLTCYCQQMTLDGPGPTRVILQRYFTEEMPNLDWYDMDGDGDLDILLKYRRTDDSFIWEFEYHQNNGTIMGNNAELIMNGTWFRYMIMDIDIDNDLDIVILDDRWLSVLENGSSQVGVTENTHYGSSAPNLHPNPTMYGSFMIDIGFDPSEPITLHLVDLQGRVVLSRSISEQKERINVNGMEAGAYVVHILEKNNISTIGSVKLIIH